MTATGLGHEKKDPQSTAISEALSEARRIISEKATADIYGDNFIGLVAAAGDVGQAKVRMELQAAFPSSKEFRVRDWNKFVSDARVKQRQGSKPWRGSGDWESELLLTSKGAVVLCEHNAGLYFENSEDWHKVLGYNEFTAQHAVLKIPPDPVRLIPGNFLEDHHDTQFARWLQIKTGLPWKVEMIRRVTDDFARRNSFHPPRDYLNSLKWDGKNRLETWLFDYAGAMISSDKNDASENDPKEVKDLKEFYSAAGQRWMMSAVARLRNPGCQVDHMLVLEGGEGLGKSSLVRIIAKGWSGTMSRDMTGKSAQELVASAVWIWELPELASLKTSREVEGVKAFLTDVDDDFRPAYGRRVVKHKRGCAFIATSNGDQYLDSAAWDDGKRRVWPIRCTRPFDLSGLAAAIDQLWAEADHRYRAGERFHFDRETESSLIETARDEQASRVPENVLADSYVVAARSCVAIPNAEYPNSVSVAEVLGNMKIPPERMEFFARKCGSCLKSAGWKHFRVAEYSNDVRSQRWRYRSPHP